MTPKIDAITVEGLQTGLTLDAMAFLPELVLCGTIVLLLVLRLFPSLRRAHLGAVTMGLLLVALIVSGLQWTGAYGFDSPDARGGRAEMFTGLLMFDNFTVFLRVFLLFFTTLVVWLSLLTGIPDPEDSSDFYVLLLGATLGMCVMSSANHLLMVFLGVEMASLPSYALAGFLKGQRRASEASLKYVVYGGGASGIMLYGISLLAGRYGTGSLPYLAAEYVKAFQGGAIDPVVALGTLFLIIGLAFKLSAVPFHFWCPDVFEGACAEVAGFLSVASKGAALALTGRILFTLTGLNETVVQAAAGGAANWNGVVQYLLPILALLGAVTATFGNLAAFLQTNLKRLLAYSTIAHAGYMIMGLAPLTREGGAAVLFYLIAYLFTNLGAFAVVAFIRNQIGSEDLHDMRGLIRRSPLLTITLAVFLLSLLGIPPLAGFAAKFQIFRVLYEGGLLYADAGQQNLAAILFGLMALAGLNTVISVFYYLKVLKVTIIETTLDEVEGRPTAPLPIPLFNGIYASVLAFLILVVGILWGPVADMSARGVDTFRERGATPDAAGQPVAQNREVQP